MSSPGCICHVLGREACPQHSYAALESRIAYLDAALAATPASIAPEAEGLRAALAGALADLAYIVWGPGRGFDQPEHGRSPDGATWAVPSKVRALLDRAAASSPPLDVALPEREPRP